MQKDNVLHIYETLVGMGAEHWFSPNIQPTHRTKLDIVRNILTELELHEEYEKCAVMRDYLKYGTDKK